MQVVPVKNVQPRNCETHGLFGSKYLKRHNLSDERWTIHDLIKQYGCLSAIYKRDNQVKTLQRKHKEAIETELYRKSKKEFKDKVEELQIILQGDVQRTKNAFINFPNYLRMYQNKQSDEVLAELDHQTFLMRKKLDRYANERQKLVDTYETRLVCHALSMSH
jgi:hypothetical protein